MNLRYSCLFTIFTLSLAGCGGSGPSAPPSGKTALLFGVTGTFSNLSSAKVIDLKATLPVGVVPILAANSARELEIGINGLYGLPPATIMFGRYSATTRQVILQAAAQDISRDSLTGNFARLTYTANGTPSFANISSIMQIYGPGGSDLTHRGTKTVTPTTY